jgi:hypothetical protein
MTVQEAIASRLAAIEAEHLEGKPITPTPAPLTVAEAIAHRLQAVAEAFTLPTTPPVDIAAHVLPATLRLTGGERVVFE